MGGYRKKKDKLTRFVPLLWDMIDSVAWGRLTNAARVALIHLMRDKDKAGKVELKLTYGQMEAIMKRDTFSRSLKQLEELGFITRTRIGGLYRRTNVFRLTQGWRDLGRRPRPEKGTVDSADFGNVGVEIKG